jgi:hypothetical protein
MSAFAVRANGDAFRAALARVFQLGSSATKLLAGEHGEGSIAQVLCNDFYPRNTEGSGCSHFRVMVTLPVLCCLRSHISTSMDKINDINLLHRIAAMRV